jgi:hypothetical protein
MPLCPPPDVCWLTSAVAKLVLRLASCDFYLHETAGHPRNDIQERARRPHKDKTTTRKKGGGDLTCGRKSPRKCGDLSSDVIHSLGPNQDEMKSATQTWHLCPRSLFGFSCDVARGLWLSSCSVIGVSILGDARELLDNGLDT